MAWKQLTIEDMKLYLSQDELDALNNISTDITDIVNKQLDVIADMFRGAFISKGYEIDTREHYIPSSYQHWVCTYARYVIWQRFPMSPSVGLDEARKEEYKLVSSLLQNAYIGVDKPLWEHSSKNPNNPDNVDGVQAGSIGLPFMRIDQEMFDSWVLDDRILDGQGMFCR